MPDRHFIHIGSHYINLDAIDIVTESADPEGNLALCVSFVGSNDSCIRIYGKDAVALRRTLESLSMHAIVPFSDAEDVA